MFDVEHSVCAECLIEHLIRTKYSTSNIQPGLNVLIEHSVWVECSIEHSVWAECSIEHSVWAECSIKHSIWTKYSTSNIQPGLNVLIEHLVWTECLTELQTGLKVR